MKKIPFVSLFYSDLLTFSNSANLAQIINNADVRIFYDKFYEAFHTRGKGNFANRLFYIELTIYITDATFNDILVINNLSNNIMIDLTNGTNATFNGSFTRSFITQLDSLNLNLGGGAVSSGRMNFNIYTIIN